MKKIASTLAVTAAAAAVLLGPVMGSATAAVPGGALPVHQDPDWGGWHRPGWIDPHNPWRDDWHCDRHGFWHDHDHDWWGHRDWRCHEW